MKRILLLIIAVSFMLVATASAGWLSPDCPAGTKWSNHAKCCTTDFEERALYSGGMDTTGTFVNGVKHDRYYTCEDGTIWFQASIDHLLIGDDGADASSNGDGDGDGGCE